MGKLIRIIIALLLIIGIVAVIMFLVRNKNIDNKTLNKNLNAQTQDLSVKNTDGTMGPQNSSKNYASTLSQNRVGSLTFFVTDPPSSLDWITFPTRIPPAVISPTSDQSPKQNFKVLIIQIKKIEVYLSDNGGHWETLDGVFPFSVDLLQLTVNDNVRLGKTRLSVGKYSEVRLYIQKADAILTDGTKINLNTSNKNGIVRIVKDFIIQTNENTNLIMDFDARKSINFNASKYVFEPYVKNLLIN